MVAPVASATPGKNDQGRRWPRRPPCPETRLAAAERGRFAFPLTEPGVRAPLPLACPTPERYARVGRDALGALLHSGLIFWATSAMPRES